jgi:hypothetical protein
MSRANRSINITASEVGDFVYCAKAWHLKRCGETAESESLEQGLIFHEDHSASFAQSERLNRLGKSIAVVAVILLIAVIVFWLVIGGAK